MLIYLPYTIFATITNIMTELIRIPILTPNTPKQYMTENELTVTDITGSTIVECLINSKEHTISTNTNYRAVLVDVWKTMPSQTILQTTKFNFKLTNEHGKQGYYWCDDIHMSFQSKDARGTLNEILNMVTVNKLTIKLSIKLKTGKIVHFKSSGTTNRVEQMKTIQNEALELFTKKNIDYGNAFAKYGVIGVLMRIEDKLQRTMSITKNGVNLINDEGIRDTLIDLHNYSAMALMLLDE